MFMIRVIAAFFWGAVTLCAQTPESGWDRLSSDIGFVAGQLSTHQESTRAYENGRRPSAMPGSGTAFRQFSLDVQGLALHAVREQPKPAGSYLLSPPSPPKFTLELDRQSESKPRIPAEYPAPLFAVGSPQLSPPRPRPVSLSHGFFVRRKIHKYASVATLPLFVAEAVVGQKLYDRTGSESDSLRSAHSALAAGIGILFGVNTVTGVWDLWDTRKIPGGRGKRLFHGILMLAADAGFVATAALAPGREDRGDRNGRDASTHRAVAFSSMGVAAAGYVYMLVVK